MTAYLPLNRANRILIARAFSRVPRVDMSIDCVIEDQMGQARVDNVHAPTVFKLEVGSFVYFAGNAATDAGHALLGTLRPYSFLMPSTPGWAEAAQAMYPERLMAIKRFRYGGETLTAVHLQRLLNHADPSPEVRQIDVAFAQQLWQQDHFIDLSDYESAEDFVTRGVGFYVEDAGTVIGAAYASLVCSRGIEISIFVQEAFRRRGIATRLAVHLLSWCLERNVHPNWDAANAPSCGLAEKLGYRPLGHYQAYYLKA